MADPTTLPLAPHLSGLQCKQLQGSHVANVQCSMMHTHMSGWEPRHHGCKLLCSASPAVCTAVLTALFIVQMAHDMQLLWD